MFNVNTGASAHRKIENALSIINASIFLYGRNVITFFLRRNYRPMEIKQSNENSKKGGVKLRKNADMKIKIIIHTPHGFNTFFARRRLVFYLQTLIIFFGEQKTQIQKNTGFRLNLNLFLTLSSKVKKLITVRLPFDFYIYLT